jgi:hypothetical protein
MKAILNIGHNIEGKAPHSASDVAYGVNSRLGNMLCPAEVRVSSYGEQTSIVQVETGPDIAEFIGRLFDLADFMEQDCIAVWFPSRSMGQLIGPKAASWGKFNCQSFLYPTK